MNCRSTTTDRAFVRLLSRRQLFRLASGVMVTGLLPTQGHCRSTADTVPLGHSAQADGAQVCFTVQGTGSPLTSIESEYTNNASLACPLLLPGITGAVVGCVTWYDLLHNGRLMLSASDGTGKTNTIHAVLLSIHRATGTPEIETVTGLSHTLSNLTIYNRHPGLQSLQIEVNGQRFPTIRVRDNQDATVSLTSALVDGSSNAISLLASGVPGASALVVLGEITGSSIAVNLYGHVVEVYDPHSLLDGSILPGGSMAATYVFDPKTPDSSTSLTRGEFWHTRPPAGVFVLMGGYTFRTDPNKVQLLIQLTDSDPYSKDDSYLIRSYNNLPTESGLIVYDITWLLSDRSAQALSSKQLGAMPPDLSAWSQPLGLTVWCNNGNETNSVDSIVSAVVDRVEAGVAAL